MKRLKTHKRQNLVLINQDEKKNRRNSGVIHVYTFLHVDFDGAECYAVRRYVNLTKYGKKEEIFVSDEQQENDGLLPVSGLSLLI